MTASINASTSSGIVQTADTSGELALQSNGTTKLTVSSTGVALTGASMTSFAGGVITSGTAVASTSGTSIDFTSIPSWVKRITIMFNGVSTTGSYIKVLVGSGSFVTSGYVSGSSRCANAGATSYSSDTAGYFINGGGTDVISGIMVICNVSGNIWVSSHATNASVNSCTIQGGGTVTNSGTLDRIRITTQNGTDTFDAGSINILYEG